MKHSTKQIAQKYALLPLVYSCSGCSSVAQLANSMAIRLDREEMAEMSCLAGVAAGRKPLLHTARSGRPVLALDGCPIHCTLHGLKQQGIEPTVHIDLSRAGIAKRFHEDATEEEQSRVWNRIVRPVATELKANLTSTIQSGMAGTVE